MLSSRLQDGSSARARVSPGDRSQMMVSLMRWGGRITVWQNVLWHNRRGGAFVPWSCHSIRLASSRCGACGHKGVRMSGRSHGDALAAESKRPDGPCNRPILGAVCVACAAVLLC